MTQNIKQRLSLRKPLAEALELTAKITDKLSLTKPPQTEGELAAFLKQELDAVKSIVPTVKDFDRNFPSLAFSIATGIGKTRLMGAIIAYLYLEHGIKHFFILAPNLTLYEKLKRDFGEPGYEKYVFKGISEFASQGPQIVTGESYDGRQLSTDLPLQINIFNIAKFNKDTKNGTKGEPRMRRLSEYIGESYFQYLAGLPDLVILMDEAHRYHADASKRAINELRPILGCEMTATPLDEKGKPFKNIVFEYNLAEALADKKYVKDPTVAGRKNFDKHNYTPDEIEIIKLEDGINVHERTKVAIELYAKQNDKPIVHPFILVACRDIAHASRVKDLLESDRIFHGKYRGKVLQIDSSTKKDEEIEQQFIALEAPDNKIEIVVHVNMLKEGWDVNNLYTIIPLRAADAAILIEQTIGRGLRLPYGGERTGNKDVDTLTVIAHENFAAVIAKAQSGDSVLSKLTYVELEEDGPKGQPGKVVNTTPTVLVKYQKAIEQAQNEDDRKIATYVYEAAYTVVETIPHLAEAVEHYGDLKKPDILGKIRQNAVDCIKQQAQTTNTPCTGQEVTERIAQLDNVIQAVVVDYEKNVIEIPRLVVGQPRAKKVFEDFELDTANGFTLADVSYEILRQSLDTGERDIIEGKSGAFKGNSVDLLVARLTNYDDVDYDAYADLLYKLAEQAVTAIRNNSQGKTDDEIVAKVNAYKESLADNIYRQMNVHSHLEHDEVPFKRVLPFSRILDQHLVENEFGYRMVSDIPETASLAKKYIVKGFLKSYYSEYRFDSSTEWDFAYLLDTSNNEVQKWLRPVLQQFDIYWDDGAKRYEPDFIVETADTVYMCEIKAATAVNADDVQKKAKAARAYCEIVSAYNAQHNGKPWKYVIIPHSVVQRTHTFDYILDKSNLFNG